MEWAKVMKLVLALPSKEQHALSQEIGAEGYKRQPPNGGLGRREFVEMLREIKNRHGEGKQKDVLAAMIKCLEGCNI